MLEGGEKQINMDEREQKILEKYANWKRVVEGHGLEFNKTVEEFVEINSCNGTGGCVGDSCSGGNGSGCMGDSCSAGGGDGDGDSRNRNHEEYIQALVEERHEKLAGKTQV